MRKIVASSTSTSFIQLSFSKPELGSVYGAGVELQPEHGVSVSALCMSVVAFHLQGAAESVAETGKCMKDNVG